MHVLSLLTALSARHCQKRAQCCRTVGIPEADREGSYPVAVCKGMYICGSEKNREEAEKMKTGTGEKTWSSVPGDADSAAAALVSFLVAVLLYPSRTRRIHHHNTQRGYGRS